MKPKKYYLNVLGMKQRALIVGGSFAVLLIIMFAILFNINDVELEGWHVVLVFVLAIATACYGVNQTEGRVTITLTDEGMDIKWTKPYGFRPERDQFIRWMNIQEWVYDDLPLKDGPNHFKLKLADGETLAFSFESKGFDALRGQTFARAVGKRIDAYNKLFSPSTVSDITAQENSEEPISDVANETAPLPAIREGTKLVEKPGMQLFAFLFAALIIYGWGKFFFDTDSEMDTGRLLMYTFSGLSFVLPVYLAWKSRSTK